MANGNGNGESGGGSAVKRLEIIKINIYEL